MTRLAPRPPWWRRLYLQVLIATALGALCGALAPQFGAALKPLGDGFIALIKMMIGPIVFCTIVHGVGSMRDLGRVGRVGLKALLYFETVSTQRLQGLNLGAKLMLQVRISSVRFDTSPNC